MKKFLFVATAAALAAASGAASAATSLGTTTYTGSTPVTVAGDIETNGATLTNSLSGGATLTLGSLGSFISLTSSSTVQRLTFSGSGNTTVLGNIQNGNPNVPGTYGASEVAVTGNGTTVTFAGGNTNKGLTYVNHANATMIFTGTGNDIGRMAVDAGTMIIESTGKVKTTAPASMGTVVVQGATSVLTVRGELDAYANSAALGSVGGAWNDNAFYINNGARLNIEQGGVVIASGPSTFRSGAIVNVSGDFRSNGITRFDGANNKLTVDGGTFVTTTLLGADTASTVPVASAHTANTIAVNNEIWLKDGALFAVTSTADLNFDNANKILKATGTVQFANYFSDVDYAPVKDAFGNRVFDKTKNKTLVLANGYTFRAAGAATVYANIDAANTAGGSINFANDGATIGNLAFAGLLSAAGDNSHTFNNQLAAGGKLTFDDVAILNAAAAGQTFTFVNATAGNTTEIKGTIFNSKAKDTSDSVKGSLAFSGGTFILSGNNAGGSVYKGDTTVATGTTLLVNNDYRGAKGAWNVASGAKLGGKGTVGGLTTITSGAVLLADRLTFTGGLNLGEAGGKTVQAMLGDMVTIADDSDLTWGGAAGGVKIDLAGTGWQFGKGHYLLFDLSEAGDFDGTLLAGSMVDYTTFTVENMAALDEANMSIGDLGIFYDADGKTFGVRGLYIMGIIPEPSTWLLLGTGVAFAVIFRRRKA